MTALALLVASSAAYSDSVLMPDDIELSGKKFHILEIGEEQVVLRVPYGDIRIPRSRILEMKVDFTERLASLKEEGGDTARTLFALGRVCSQLEMPQEAAAAYREAFDRGDMPEDLLLPMAAELEGIEAWGAAQKCYAAYLKLHPDRSDVAAKARAVAAKAAAETPVVVPLSAGDVKIEVTQAPRAAVHRPVQAPPGQEPPEQQPPGQQPPPEQQPPGQQPPEQQPPEQQPPPAPGVQEGLEADPSWSTEAWGSSVEVSVGPPQGTTDKMVRVLLAGAEHDKACVLLEQDFDLSEKKTMSFEVYNFAKQSVTLAVAFTTSPGWKFYESVPQAVVPTGNNPKKVAIELDGERFTCAETRWRHRSALSNRNRVVKVYFLIYTKMTGEWLFFNNIQFEPADAAAAGAPAAPPGGAPAPGAPPAPAVNP
jgi:hypothetical protein